MFRRSISYHKNKHPYKDLLYIAQDNFRSYKYTSIETTKAFLDTELIFSNTMKLYDNAESMRLKQVFEKDLFGMNSFKEFMKLIKTSIEKETMHKPEILHLANMISLSPISCHYTELLNQAIKSVSFSLI